MYVETCPRGAPYQHLSPHQIHRISFGTSSRPKTRPVPKAPPPPAASPKAKPSRLPKPPRHRCGKDRMPARGTRCPSVLPLRVALSDLVLGTIMHNARTWFMACGSPAAVGTLSGAQAREARPGSQEAQGSLCPLVTSPTAPRSFLRARLFLPGLPRCETCDRPVEAGLGLLSLAWRKPLAAEGRASRSSCPCAARSTGAPGMTVQPLAFQPCLQMST